ncbi:MAG: M1 family metallopeptidase [Planctomycetes bacterium]|nr:M1 family metallopeptidase [Planctomycetota bacterium]
MKLRLVLCLVAAGACSTSKTAAPAASGAPGATRAARHAALAVPPLVAHEPRIADFDVEHYALELTLDPATRSIAGTCTVRLWPRIERLGQFELDLVGLDVSAVRDADGRALEFEQDEDSIAIELARSLSPDEFARVSIDYSGSPARGLYFVGDEGEGPTHVYTQGECEDARYWFPCYDFPNDRATSEIAVTLPPKWTSIAAGTRIDRRELDGGRAREHWSMNTPHPTYLVTLCAGEFTVTEARWQNVPLLFAVPPKLAPLAERTFEETDEVLTFLSDVTGFRYPYPKYAQTCVDDFRFGGMENISATTLTDDCLRDELGLRDGTTTSLIAHEAAHQWFGDLLTCADWSHIWLNEGFATYMDLLYVEATRSADVFHERLRGTLESYLGGDVGARRRPTVWNVYREPFDLFFDGQTYPGGALRLHHLRFVLGDELFFKGLREYVWSNAGRSVVTEDFQRAMERASGQDLEAFFQQWFHSKGYPEFSVSWKWDEDAKELVVDVEQVQDSADGTPAVFRAPVEVLFGAGKDVQTKRLQVTKRQETFRIGADVQPNWLAFDPRLCLPRRADVEYEPDEAGWLMASAEASVAELGARELARIARDTSAALDDRAYALVRLTSYGSRHASAAVRRISALAAVVSTDPDVARRTEALVRQTTGAEVESGAAELEVLRELTVLDPEASVRAAAWEALAAFPPSTELVDRAKREVLEAGFSWQTRIQAARLVALAEAKRGAEHARAWLGQCLAIPSPHGEFQAGILGVLGELEGERALDVFQRWLDDERAPDQARQAAARALGAHGRAVKTTRIVLERHLDAHEFQRTGAVLDALFQLGDAASIPAVRRFAEQPLDARQRRACERILSANWASNATGG